MTALSQYIRFGIAGGSGFITTFILTFVLTEYASWWYGASFTLAAVIGNAVIFACNYLFTFREAKGALVARASAFSITYFGSFLLNAFVVIFCTEVIGSHYLVSIVVGTFVAMVINFLVSKHIIFSANVHPFVSHAIHGAQKHGGAIVLALVAAIIVFLPNVMLWSSPEYRGIEIMMLDAENHYFARVHQVYEGDLAARETFLPIEEKMPYATPPFGEIIIAFFGKAFGLEAAHAAVVSKPLSVAGIVLLIYAFAFALSRSRYAALLAAAIPIFGYSLITFSPAPIVDLLTGSPHGGPFLFFSRLVNSSISGLFMFGGLLLMYRTLFEGRSSWRAAFVLGALIGVSVYITPYTFSFLGALLFLSWIWLLVRREFPLARHALVAGILALIITIPFILNIVALQALPGYEHFARFVGLVGHRGIVLGLLLPLMVALVALCWPERFSRSGRTFLLLACAALFLVLNQQLLTGTPLQSGHYHWYITKPLAGIVAGLFVWHLIERFVPLRAVRSAVFFVLALIIFNSMGFVAPWYTETRAEIVRQQQYGPVVEYLATLPTQEVVWASVEASDFIPIYTNHGAPNSVNLGAYPLTPEYFDNRLFLEYRLRGVRPGEFANTIRKEAHHVSDRLWGLWLRELTGDPAAVPEEEFTRLNDLYAKFYARSWDEVFNSLKITAIVAHSEEVSMYRTIPILRERARVGDFVVFERF